jgi:hypothetical protein
MGMISLLLLNGLRLSLQIVNGVAVVSGAVVPPARGKPPLIAVLLVKNGPWLTMELEGEGKVGTGNVVDRERR